MANDPHRDILPVKENSDRGSCDRIDPLLVSRFKRQELEDRFIRLYEENNDLKRLTNSQEGKIKKLGTKLLRVINEKKTPKQLMSRKNGDSPSNEDLQVKLLEMEHENYVLKDKNIVLKQQLASHSRQHMAAHRSPVLLRRAPSSPRMSQRETSVPNVNEGSYTLSNRQNSSELQLRDAEVHIASLNEEIKLLHTQIETLQREIEKSTVMSRKAQVGENIELIKLKRQNKQLEAQLKVAEHNQKLLQQDVTRLQKENEEALQIIAERQNEMIDIQTNLDDAAQIQIQFQEINGTVADLTNERNLLKERCEALMKTISEKTNDAEVHAKLRRQLAEVKTESASLRQELEIMRIQNSFQATQTQTSSTKRAALTEGAFAQTQTDPEATRGHGSTDDLIRLDSWKSPEGGNSEPNSARSFVLSEPYNVLQQLARARVASNQLATETENAPVVSAAAAESTATILPAVPSNPEPTIIPPGLGSLGLGALGWAGVGVVEAQQGLAAAAERLSLQRESECLRDMLRAQTQRCDAQDNQIMRLQQQMKLNEDRYKDVFQQRDLFFRLLDKGSHKADQPDGVGGKDQKHPEQFVPMLMGSDSDSESEDCPSGNTYTKQDGTYTKPSPKNSTKAASPEKTQIPQIEPRVSSAVEKLEGIESQPSGPVAPAPVPIPRTRVSSAKNPPVKIPSPQHQQVQVSILWLQLEADSRLVTDANVKALYVDFTILSKTSEDFETPQALPKPTSPGFKSVYDFTAVVPWTDEMLSALQEVKGRGADGDVVVFNIVSEPPDDGAQDEVHCPVVGMASISLHQFALAEPDQDILLPMYDVGRNKLCGSLAARLQVPAAIQGALQ